MLPKFSRISGFLAVAVAVFATSACDTNKVKSPSNEFQSPVVPTAGLSVTLGSTRFTLQVADDNKSAVITVQALRTVNWTPVPNQTEAMFTTTLGAFGNPSGGQSETVELFDGKGSVVLFPGSTAGSARVRVEVEGVSAQLTITIKPDPTGGVPPEPAPVQTTLTLQASPGVVSEQDAVDDGAGPTGILFTATILGNDGNPFSGAGVFFTSDDGLGTFLSSGSGTGTILTTNGAGQVADTLSIPDAALLGFPGSSFKVTGHLGVVGGEKTATVTITIVAGPAPDEASSVDLQADASFVNDDGADPDPINLDATVFDQSLDTFAGATVIFSSTLGNPTPNSDTSDNNGLAESTLTLTKEDVANHPSNSFTVTAKITTSSGTATDNVVITIVRSAAKEPKTVQILAAKPTVVDDGDGDTIDFDAIVRDQNGDVLGGVTVTFSKSGPGTFSGGGTDVSDGSGVAETTLSISDADFDAFLGGSFSVTATIGIQGGTDTDTVIITIVRPPTAEFHWEGTSGSSVMNFLDDSTGGPTSWAWDFDGDGTTDNSIVQNPSAVDLGGSGFACANPCPVKLTVTNAAGSSSITHNVPNPLP